MARGGAREGSGRKRGRKKVQNGHKRPTRTEVLDFIKSLPSSIRKYPKGRNWNSNNHHLDAPLIRPELIPPGYSQYWDFLHKEYRLTRHSVHDIIKPYPNNIDSMEDTAPEAVEVAPETAQEATEVASEEVALPEETV